MCSACKTLLPFAAAFCIPCYKYSGTVVYDMRVYAWDAGVMKQDHARMGFLYLERRRRQGYPDGLCD